MAVKQKQRVTDRTHIVQEEGSQETEESSLLEETESLLDEIDSLLEERDVLVGFVQRGGQ